MKKIAFSFDHIDKDRISDQLSLHSLVGKAEIFFIIKSDAEKNPQQEECICGIQVFSCVKPSELRKFLNEKNIGILFDCFAIQKFPNSWFLIARELQIPLAKINSAALPSLKLFKKICYWASKSPKKLVILTIRNLANVIFHTKKPSIRYDIILYAGHASKKFGHRSTCYIDIAINDFYRHKKIDISNSKPLLNEKYILFIDDCIVDGWDMALLSIEPPMSRESYYSCLNHTFECIEKRLGLSVVIAGHPDGKHVPDYKSLFGNREFFYSKAAELAKEAELVVTHASTAISYAVLWEKPILLLSHAVLDRSYKGPLIEAFKLALSTHVVDMGNPEKSLDAIACQGLFGKRRYEYYRRQFIGVDTNDQGDPWSKFLQL